eukprot:9978351-Karenia_brevis.AAC.1
MLEAKLPFLSLGCTDQRIALHLHDIMYGRALLTDLRVSLEGVSSGLLGAILTDGLHSSLALAAPAECELAGREGYGCQDTCTA